jgi:hypothetical protein
MSDVDDPRPSAAGPARLRAPVRWALAGTLLATVASLLWPNRGLVPAQDRAVVALPLRSTPASAGTATASVVASESAMAPSGAASTSAARTFDPFIGVVPPPPPAPPPLAQAVVVAPPPAPPVQDYRFLGRITGPDGGEQILLTRGESVVAASVGTTLDNGYVVESISNDALVLEYPGLASKASIAIGPPPGTQ